MAICILLLAAVVSVMNPLSAQAVGTVLFQNAFNNRTVDGTGTVSVPTPASGANTACLTASGNSATPPLLSCSSSTDAQGSGKLRMTGATGNQIGGIFGQTSFPTSNGLDVTFNTYQWGGGGADGMAFMLAAVDPANPVAPTTIGPGGGSLGYSPGGSIKGLPNAYLGVGLDVYGNYSSFGGSGCPTVTNITAQTPGAVVVRGPGNNLAGYCALRSTYDGTSASKVTLRASTRAASVVPVQVLINPSTTAFTSATGVSVSAGTYKVVVTPVGTTAKTLAGPLPTVAAGVYPSSSWLTSAGVPKQLAFAFVGSTGAVTDAHEASDVKVLTFNPVPQLAVDSTSYSAAAPQPGAPVTYTVSGSVLAGADETSPVSITQTTPSGVVPVGAYGSGWVCGAPVGQNVTCTTSSSSIANGTTLPTLTVVAIVTGSSITSSIVQNSSATRISSSDGNPATDSVTTAGTLPAAPTGITVTPATGPTAGGNAVTIGGSNITGATAIEIGTAAEQAGGTPVTLLPCVAPATTGCFSVSGNTLVVASMPSRPTSTAVTVTVVTAGLAGAANYTYAAAPAVPATPVAAAGVTSASVTWAEPAANGSPVTGYTITQYLGTAVVSTVTAAASELSRTFTGLTPGGSYSYTVAATNAFGTSAPSAKSNAVVPYTVPGSPSITAANPATSSATLSWSAPSSTGFSPITGYVVTPYIGQTAQPAQTFASTATTQTITGLTPGTAYTFTVAAQNAAGTGAPSARSSTVTPNLAPSLTFPATMNGEVGVAFTRQLTVNDGTSPFTWSISSGTLPAGLTLNASTGVLSGTPTSAETAVFTVRVVDASGQIASKQITFTVAAAPSITFTPPSGEVSVPYSAQPVLSGGTPAITWSVSAGSLPGGVTINTTTGQLSGTPTTAGSFTPAITATDSFGQTATKTVTIVIAALPAFTFSTPPSAQIGVAYSYSFDVSGGSAPLSWAVTAGTLPAGLTLNTATGVVSGTPTASTSAPITITVTDANGKSASRNTTLTVNVGPLVITKSANVTSAAPGTVVSYTIVITNSNTSAFTGVSLSENLSGVTDDATYNANAAATSGTVSYSAPTLSWSGSVPASGSVSITYTVTVNTPAAGDKVLSSRVTSPTLGTNCASASTDTRCATAVTVPGLTLAITPSVTSTTPGDVVGFTVTARNTGQTPLTAAAFAVTLAGALDDSSYNTNAQASAGTLAYNAPTLSWAGSLAVNATVTVTYSVTIRDPDTGDRSATSVVSSSTPGSTCPVGSQAAACTATALVRIPALAITTTTPSTSTTPGSTVPFTITIANTGQVPYTAATGRQAVVTTSLVDALDDGVYAGNAATTAGSVRFDAASGSLIFTGDIAVGASVTVTASVTVNQTVTGDKTLVATTTSSAAGSTCPPGGSGTACSATVLVLVPALSIHATADAQTTTPGSTVAFTVTVSNTGQTPYSGANFSDPLTGILDDATYDNNATATTGAVSVANQTLSWVGDLAVGASATIRFTVTVKNPDPGDLALANRITSTTVGSNCAASSTDPLCRTSVTVLIPGLTFDSAFDAATTTPGSTLTYTATVTNTGQTTYTGTGIALDLSGVLDDATYDRNARVTTGSATFTADTSAATWVLTLAPGASATLTFSVTASDPDPGDRSLRVLLSSTAAGSTCPPASSSAACVAVSTLLVPGLVITKSADGTTVSPGGRVTYTLVATNTGETTFRPASLSDPLAMVLTDATYADDAVANSGTATYDAGSTTLSWQGELAPGRSVTITYSVVILDPDPGDKRITNTVSSATPGNNCLVGSTDTRCTSTVDILVPSLTIANAADVSTTVPGATVTYTVTVTNSGPTAYPAASFADALTDVVDDAVVTAGPSATSGAATLSGTTLSWTGALQPGAVSRITFSVRVNAADGGNNDLASTVTSTSKGSTCANAQAAGACSSNVPVARLLLQQQYSSPTTTPGATLSLTATFTNTGKVDYTGISVTSPSADKVDDAIPAGNQQASSGTLVLSGTAITWTGNIPAGSQVTVTGDLTVISPPTGNRIVTGTLQSQAPGNNCPAQTTDPRCTATSAVLVPALTLSVSASTTATVPGSSVGYTVTIGNTGQTPYNQTTVAVGLAGSLDDANFNDDAVATGGAVSFTGQGLSWSGDLGVGQTVTVTYTLTVKNPDPADKTLITQLSSDAVGSSCPPSSSNAACRNTVIVLTPALTFEKTSDATNVTLGSTVNYTVTVTNTGQTSYPAADFTDALTDVTDDATVVAGSLAASSGNAALASGTISWSGALAPNASATITYAVAVASPSSGNRTMSNTVVSNAAGSNCSTGSTDARCTAVVVVTNVVSLTISKTSNVTHAAAGDTVNYSVTIVNASASRTRTPNFTDALAGVLDDAVYNNNASTDVGTVQLTGSNLVWQGTLVPGAKATLTYSVTISTPGGGDQRLTSSVSSTSVPASNNCIAGSTDPRCSNVVLVAGLVISQRYTETSTTPGSLVHLVATYTNTGQYPYDGISVEGPTADAFDDAIPSGDQTASSGTLVLTGSTVTWEGSIPVGGSVTVSGTLTIANPDTGNRVLRGTLVSNTVGSNCRAGSTDARCTATLAVLLPALAVTKTANTTFVVPGGTASYTIAVRNTGETAYSGASVTDVLSGVLDDAAYNNDAVASSGTVVYAEPELVWTGDLAVGAAATITYSVTAFSPPPGDKTMINPVSSTDVGSTCPPFSGNAACRSTVAVLTPALTVTSEASTASTLPGSTVTFTITATNSGQVPFAAANFTIDAAGVLDDATVGGAPTASSGTATLDAAARTIAWTGGLGVGAAATVSYPVIVGTPPAGDHLLAQTVTSTSSGSTCSAAQSDARCSSTVTIAGLAISNHVDTATTKPTSVVAYTGTFTNTGTVPYVGITVSDSFVGTLDDATYNGDATATSGSLIIVVGSGQIVWTGDIAVGQTVTITGSVTVNNPPTGDGTLRTRLSSDAPANNCTASSTDPICATAVTVLVPGLALAIAADRSVVSPGGIVSYTTSIANTGQTAYVGAVVDTDLTGALNDGAYLGPGTVTAGTLSLVGTTLRWTGDLSPGATVTVQYGIRVDDPDRGDRAMVTSLASDELGSTCATGSATAACTTLVTVLVPALDLAITADRTTTVPGASVGYTVTIRNSGQTAYTAATVSVDLSAATDDALAPVAPVATGGTVTAGGAGLVWTGDLDVGASALITYSLVVRDPDTGNRLLTSTLSSAEAGSTCALDSCVSTVTVLIPGLALSQAADSATTTPGTRTGFTITVANVGQTPYDSAQVSASLADMTDDGVIDPAVVSTTGVASLSGGSLAWTGSLPVGATAIISYAVTPNDPPTGNRVLTSRVVADVAGSTCRSDSADPACTVTTTILIPGLAISTTADTPTTTPGGRAGFSVLISNTGETAYDSVSVTDSLAGIVTDATYNGDAAADSGTLQLNGTDLVWTGSLQVGASARITFSATINSPYAGDRVIRNVVRSTEQGSTCPPGSGAAQCMAEIRVLIPALQITTTASVSTVVAGESVGYRIRITNTGETVYSAATVRDALTGVLDDATYNQDAATTLGTVSYGAGAVTWTGPLAVGATAEVTFSVTVNFPVTGNKSLRSTTTSTTQGANCVTGAETGCRTQASVIVPGLTIQKTAAASSVVAGGALSYTIVATNSGESDFRGAVITDDLAGVLDDAVYNADARASSGAVSGPVAGGPSTLTWTGDLARGQTVTIGYSVRANLTESGDAVLLNTVASPTIGSTCVAGSGAAGNGPACRVSVPVAARTIGVSGLTDSFTLTGLPGATVTRDGAVTMTVTTNSSGGYAVSVRPLTETLAPLTPSNTDSIPIAQLLVRPNAGQSFAPLTTAAPITTYSQNRPSAPGGDAVVNDFRVQIPFVADDTYSATLEYIVSAQ